MPIYNAEKTLARAIESVIDNESEEFELILINDGSTDSSREICEIYKNRDSRIRFINIQNSGVSIARNIGIINSTGSYITFIDSDDYYSKGAIGSLISMLDNKIELIIFSHYKERTNGKIINNCKLRNRLITSKEELHIVLFEFIKNEVINPPWNKIYLKEKIKSNKLDFPKDIDIGEDLLFNLNYIKDITSVRLVSDSYMHYIVKKNEGLVSRFRENRLNIRLYIITQIIELLLEWDILDEYKEKDINDIIIKDIFAFFMDFYKKSCNYNHVRKVEIIKDTLNNKEINKFVSNKNNNILIKILALILKSKSTTLILITTKLLSLRRKIK